MLQFSTGALLLLLTWFGDLVTGKISDDFSECLNFFYQETPPQGITGQGYQPICQRYKNQYHFATLYNRQHRAPLYSAYTVGATKGKRPEEEVWLYEPQLGTKTGDQEMQPFQTPVDRNVIGSQAELDDYKKSIYTKGHLAPTMHQDTLENREATYTLTNIVPQREGSNNGPWRDLETSISQRFTKYCTGKMYVITGGIPFEPEERWINEDRVSVPEYMWSAYCCPSFKPDIPEKDKIFFPTYAAVGRNHPDSGEDIVPKNPKLKPQYLGYDVRPMSLETLEGILKDRPNMKNINLFHGQCK